MYPKLLPKYIISVILMANEKKIVTFTFSQRHAGYVNMRIKLPITVSVNVCLSVSVSPVVDWPQLVLSCLS